MKKISVFVDTKGKLKCLYNELLNLKKSGVLTLNRVASVEPDTLNHGCWKVKIFGEVKKERSFDTRSEALIFEEQCVIRRLRNGK